MSVFRPAVLGLALSLGGFAAQAQTANQAPAGRQPDAAREQPPLPGANSFTETQARHRIATAGYGEVSDLKQDQQGVWRGTAKREGREFQVALDYRGNIVQSQQ